MKSLGFKYTPTFEHLQFPLSNNFRSFVNEYHSFPGWGRQSATVLHMPVLHFAQLPIALAARAL